MDTYEKKYKGALARCKWLLSEGMISKIAATDMFRELIDDDNENIRKEIINIFHSLAEGKIPVDINYADIFTWLEKQKTIDVLDKEEREFADNVDSYRKDMDEFYKKGYNAGREAEKQYWLEKQGEEKPRYSIGDVLCDKSCTTFNKESQPNFEITDIMNGMYICDKCSFPISQQDEYELVAKRIEQKPTFEMKTPEESLDISSEEYKKIVDTCLYGEKIESKPSWSEEDDKMYNSLTEFEKAVKQVMEEAIECGDTHNLKADADMLLRLTQKPWSEEDEKRIKDIIYFLDTAKKHYASTVELDACIDWLKSLRTQNTWKPSDAQMQALKEACDKHWEPDGVDPLYTLYEQLKKLKEK